MTGVPTYGDFVEAIRLGNVSDSYNGQTYQLSRVERRRNWAIPSYDFGRLLDANCRKNILNRLPQTFSGRAETPDKNRVMLFTFDATRFVLIQRIGMWGQPVGGVSSCLWLFFYVGNGHWSNAVREPSLANMLVACADYLLDNPVEIEVLTDASTVASANRRRRMASGNLLPSTKVLSLTRRRWGGPKAAARSTGLGSPKRPHDRGAHDRHYANGTVAHIPACKIHKDCMDPTDFVVVP